MDFLVNQQDDVTVITLKGSLLADVQTKDILHNVTGMIEKGKHNFVVNLSDLKFINSSGLGMLLTCLTKARKVGGDVILVNVPEQVSNLLVMTKLNSIFQTADSVEKGLAKFKS